MFKINNLLSALLILLSVFSGDLFAANESKVGIVLLHGKWGNPSKHINNLAESMRSSGYIVLTPLMPWSKYKGYDRDYPAALEIIDQNIKELRNKGATLNVHRRTVNMIRASSVENKLSPCQTTQ